MGVGVSLCRSVFTVSLVGELEVGAAVAGAFLLTELTAKCASSFVLKGGSRGCEVVSTSLASPWSSVCDPSGVPSL